MCNKSNEKCFIYCVNLRIHSQIRLRLFLKRLRLTYAVGVSRKVPCGESKSVAGLVATPAKPSLFRDQEPSLENYVVRYLTISFPANTTQHIMEIYGHMTWTWTYLQIRHLSQV